MTLARLAVAFPFPNTHAKPSCRTTPWSVLVARGRSPENAGLFEPLEMLKGCWLSCTWICDCCVANNDHNLDSVMSLWKCKWQSDLWFRLLREIIFGWEGTTTSTSQAHLGPIKEEHTVGFRNSLLPWWCERWSWEDSSGGVQPQRLLLLLHPSAAFVSFQKPLSHYQAFVAAAGRLVTPVFCCSSVSSCYNRIREAIRYKPYRFG